MPVIQLETVIHSSMEICFDLSRSINLHVLSTAQTNEHAIEGKTTGLISLNESVTWEARHFGVKQRLTSKITAYNKPFHFRDEQTKGIFKFMQHDHSFEQNIKQVIMKDSFVFESPFGIAGKVFNTLVLTKYLTKFLKTRNNLIKEFAETEKWKLVLNETDYNKKT